MAKVSEAKLTDFIPDPDNAKRRAIAELFGEHVEVKIFSMRRIPSRTIRRELKV